MIQQPLIGWWQIYVGDCMAGLASLPDQSVQCCVTSPPYFGLRDYGMARQIGLEQTPDAYVARLVEVFREVRRVLRDDGTLWLNLGDSYAGSGKGAWDIDDDEKKRRGVKETYRPNKNPVVGRHTSQSVERGVGMDRRFGLKQKDLIGIPWRVAFALQADGWYLRQDIIWHKPNPMPESVTDRCTKAHEYLFMLSKSARYFYDADAVKEPAVSTSIAKFTDRSADKQRRHGRRHEGFNGRYAKKLAVEGVPETRNRRSVWAVATKPYSGAHFATFPPDLIEPCILAGCPLGGTVLDPFGGSGTTAGVATKYGRNALLIELNPEYAAMVQTRVEAIRK